MSGLVQYNFTIDDTSPILFYSPYADTGGVIGRGDGLRNAWQTWYTVSGFLPNRDGPSTEGESYHLTSAPGASVSLSFYGTGVVLYGMSNCSYDIIFDGNFIQDATPFQNVLFAASDEAPGFHKVSLIAKPNSNDQILSFNSTVIMSVANSSASSTPVYETIDNQNTSAIAYAGDWSPTVTVPKVPTTASPAPYHDTTVASASASFNFTGRAVALYGSSTSNHGPYTVTLDGTKSLFNGSSQWLLGNMLLFYQDGLEEDSTHSLSIMNVGSDPTSNALSLNSVQITHLNDTLAGQANTGGTHSTSKSKVGVIVGPVVAFFVVASMIGFYVRSKRQTKRKPMRRRSSAASFIFSPRRFCHEHDEHDDSITPYVADVRDPRRDIGASSESSSLQLRLTGHHHGIGRAKDRKGRPLPIPAGVPQNIRGTDSSASADARSAQSVPVTYLPSELRASRSEGAGSHINSRSLRRSPAASESVSHNISDDPSVVGRIVELVAQRIDAQRVEGSGSAPDSSNQLPPYSEGV
ncbi:uncharacterized protein FOMMEDRAFT_167065 [Fomitiporia mediterranea MF3/22]|uniref:uncharacterized protein n=1 Tax=Fomitiporia mediterranea (strain MF3/22) TaxID=694068 RepID=UPI0004407972|nr:uncharacterized protein FOMMEDRAFT_167065 [Fomitiporia mediterranea MF3/22]EJD03738.1 hypothetical protein FOMMEDRAFT_167065 [Fomitiporia mediterranea MF3/22]